MPLQHLTGLQWVPVANWFYYYSVAGGGFLEDGTSLPQSPKRVRDQFQRGEHEPSAVGEPRVYLKPGGTSTQIFAFLEWIDNCEL